MDVIFCEGVSKKIEKYNFKNQTLKAVNTIISSSDTQTLLRNSRIQRVKTGANVYSFKNPSGGRLLFSIKDNKAVILDVVFSIRDNERKPSLIVKLFGKKK